MKHLLPQIAEKKLLFATSFAEENAPHLFSADARFALEPSNGPAMTWIGPADTGISGPHTLKVSGCTENGGNYSATLFDNLRIPVSADTKLRYHLFPAMHTAHYDHSYTGMYFSIDLIFSDGSALSSLGVRPTKTARSSRRSHRALPASSSPISGIRSSATQVRSLAAKPSKRSSCATKKRTATPRS